MRRRRHENGPSSQPVCTPTESTAGGAGDTGPTRRTVLTGAAALAAVGLVPGAAQAATRAPHGVPTGTVTVLAINSYRQSGGGNFPHVSTAPVLYNAQREIRQAIIDRVSANGVVDATQFASVDWKLVAGNDDVRINP